MRTRVLVVDDSVVARKLLCDALGSSADVQVAGTAASGSIALAKIPQLNPDLITLDIEMPGMNGLETLVEIRKLYPKLPIIMFSSLTERGAVVTLEALSLGASDYATKPIGTDDLEATLEQVRQELVPKIVALVARKNGKAPPVIPAPVKRSSAPSRIDILAIGTSTGGPNALAEVIPKLPRDFPVPVVVVQHMPPLFTHMLAERLNSRSSLTVREGKAGQRIEPGCVWIAPGDYHMKLARCGGQAVLATDQGPPENSCRPAVDPLFRSVAQAYGPNVLGVVLTGMGSDGTRGAEAIREAGGEVIVQDEASSVVWGMPGSVVAARQADHVYPLDRVAPEIELRVVANRSRASAAGARLNK